MYALPVAESKYTLRYEGNDNIFDINGETSTLYINRIAFGVEHPVLGGATGILETFIHDKSLGYAYQIFESIIGQFYRAKNAGVWSGWRSHENTGTLSHLTTVEKDSLVSAVNEVNHHIRYIGQNLIAYVFAVSFTNCRNYIIYGGDSVSYINAMVFVEPGAAYLKVIDNNTVKTPTLTFDVTSNTITITFDTRWYGGLGIIG